MYMPHSIRSRGVGGVIGAIAPDDMSCGSLQMKEQKVADALDCAAVKKLQTVFLHLRLSMYAR